MNKKKRLLGEKKEKKIVRKGRRKTKQERKRKFGQRNFDLRHLIFIPLLVVYESNFEENISSIV